MPFDGRILSGVSVLAPVCDGGSFVKAAELIGLTDSGVSRAIGRLEARLGVRLLDRTTRSVSLADEGRRFYEAAKPHLPPIRDAAGVPAARSDDPLGLVDRRGTAVLRGGETASRRDRGCGGFGWRRGLRGAR